MKTIVYQAYDSKIPSWISKCMKTVKEWTEKNGFEYAFIDERIYDYVPDWYIKKTKNNILPISDLARLEIAKEYLNKGYDRTIWIDTDVIIFDTDKFNIEVEEEFAFCKEIGIGKRPNGKVMSSQAVTNSVCVFTKNNSMLDFYIYSCKSLVKNKKGDIHKCDVGTTFLTKLYKDIHFPLLTNAGLFSPRIMFEIAYNKNECIKKYIKTFGHPMYAANLCSSLENMTFNNFKLEKNIYHRVIDKLIKTKGSIINNYL